MSGRHLSMNAPQNFDFGYQSHIRGYGKGNPDAFGYCHKVYVDGYGIPAGNEAGTNASLFPNLPACGYVIEVNRRHDGHNPHKMYPNGTCYREGKL